MLIEVNGEVCGWQPDLQQLLATMGLLDAHVATAVNGEFVPAGRRELTALAEGDRIEILAPMQGG